MSYPVEPLTAERADAHRVVWTIILAAVCAAQFIALVVTNTRPAPTPQPLQQPAQRRACDFVACPPFCELIAEPIDASRMSGWCWCPLDGGPDAP